MGFFEGDAGEMFDDAPEGGGVGDAEHSGADLGVEHIFYDEAAVLPCDFDVLVAGVADFFDLVVGKQLPKGLHLVAVDGYGVNQFDAVIGGDLDQAQDGLVGIFADEFGIEGEAASGAQVFAKLGESGGVIDYFGSDCG